MLFFKKMEHEIFLGGGGGDLQMLKKIILMFIKKI